MCFSGTKELPAQHGHCFSFLSVTAVLLDCRGYIIFYLNRFEGVCEVDLVGIELQPCKGGRPVNYLWPIRSPGWQF